MVWCHNNSVLPSKSAGSRCHMVLYHKQTNECMNSTLVGWPVFIALNFPIIFLHNYLCLPFDSRQEKYCTYMLHSSVPVAVVVMVYMRASGNSA